MEKNCAKKEIINSIMDVDRSQYLLCEEAVARLMYGFDIPIEFQPNLLEDLREEIRNVLEERDSEDNEQSLSLDEIENVTREKISQWRRDDCDCGNCN